MSNKIEPRLSDVVSWLQSRVTALYPNYCEGDAEERTRISLQILQESGLVQQACPGEVWSESEAMREDFRDAPYFFHEALDEAEVEFFEELFSYPILPHCLEQGEPDGISEEDAEKYVRGDHVSYEVAFRRALRLFYLPVLARLAILWQLKEEGLIDRRDEKPLAIWNPTSWAFFNNIDPADKMKMRVCES